jgi:hypothetical protein
LRPSSVPLSTPSSNWEKDRITPPARHFPAIIAFLGYDLFPPPQTLSEPMIAKPRAIEWSIVEAALQLGVDQSTWGV